MRDYEKHGVVPGVLIDGKALENRLNIPLITLCGSNNYGSTKLFDREFVQGEK